MWCVPERSWTASDSLRGHSIRSPSSRLEFVKKMSCKQSHKKGLHFQTSPIYLQCLTIAIVFELFYTKRAMSRVWLTSINLDPKCHSYLVC